MDTHVFAYLAGAIDSDGSISIKRSTYHRRMRDDAHSPVYSERVMLKQVTPEVPHLLRDTFGGTCRVERPQTANSKPLWAYMASDLNAAKTCAALLPYLRVKRRQAEVALELRESKQGRYEKAAYWFVLEYPDWSTLELVDTREAAQMLGHTDWGSVSQAVQNGTLLALPYDRSGAFRPRIPRMLVERVKAQAGRGGRSQIQAPQLVAWRERLYQQIRDLNKIGVDGTAVYHRMGCFTPAG